MSGMVLAVLAASLAAIVGPAPGLATTRAAPTPDLAFKGARIGMTLDQWRLLPYPGRAGDHVVAACSTASAAGSLPAAAASRAPAPMVVCDYVDPVGGMTLAQSFVLTKTYLARRPTYYFVDGRLARIEFHSSIDAFDDVMAILESRYGPATETLRDEARDSFGGVRPRVQKVWRLPKGAIRLIDPSSRPDELCVQIGGEGAGRPRPML